MAKLLIRRKESFISKNLKYKVFVDGQDVAILKNGESVELDVAAGSHTLKTGGYGLNGTSSEKTFTAVDGKTTRFLTGPRTITLVLFFLVILLAINMGKLVSTGQIAATIVLLVPLVIIGFLAFKFSVFLDPIDGE